MLLRSTVPRELLGESLGQSVLLMDPGDCVPDSKREDGTVGVLDLVPSSIGLPRTVHSLFGPVNRIHRAKIGEAVRDKEIMIGRHKDEKGDPPAGEKSL